MAALDLSDLGVTVTSITPAETPGEYVANVDTSVLRARLSAFRDAAKGVVDAWDALPVGARKACGDMTITLHAEER